MIAPTVKPSSVTVVCALEHIEAHDVVITPAIVGAMNALFDAPRDDDSRGLERLLILTGEFAQRALVVVSDDSKQEITFGGVLLVAALDCANEMVERLGVQL